jgi:hypothetical protein
MKHHLNYNKEDPNYILFAKIFKIIGFKKAKTIMASKGIKTLILGVYQIKLFLQPYFSIQQ